MRDLFIKKVSAIGVVEGMDSGNKLQRLTKEGPLDLRREKGKGNKPAGKRRGTGHCAPGSSGLRKGF